MKDIAKDVQRLFEGLKAVTRQMDRLITRADKLAQAQAAQKREAQAKAKPSRKAPLRKSMKGKRSGALGATDQVLSNISRAKKGVDVPTLIRKTGFEGRKIRNIVARAMKLGRIERAGRGVYLAAEERRRHSRIDSLNLLWYACIDEKNQVVREGMGRTLNVTEDGILLETHRPIDPKEVLSLCIGVKDDVLDVKKGKVVYCNRGKDGKFRSGIEFKEADETAIRTLKKVIIAFGQK